MPDDLETKYRDLEATHRQLERDVQTAALEERKELQRRVGVIESSYWSDKDLEMKFKEQDIRIYALEKRMWMGLGIIGAVTFGLEIYKIFKP